MPSNKRSSQGNNPANNLSEEDRRRGGQHSAAMQNRDSLGEFAGKKGGFHSSGSSGSGHSGGRSSGNRGSNLTEEARRRGGEHSAAIQDRDRLGEFAGEKNRDRSSGKSGGNSGSSGGSAVGRGSPRTSEGNMGSGPSCDSGL